MVSNIRRTNVADENFLSGKSPAEGTLGPVKTAGLQSKFAGKLKQTNPRQPGFFAGSETFSSVSPESQAKIDMAAQTQESSFGDPAYDDRASNFLKAYIEAGDRGIIEPEEMVRPENLDRLVSQPANYASNERSPNTASKFPGASGVNI